MNTFKKTSITLGWVAFALSTMVYLLTMEPSASLWDCGEFIATSYKLEVGHPPGAPLFMMINRLFTIFAPSQDLVAAFVNAASAVASGLTVAFLFWTIAHMGRRITGKEEEEISGSQLWLVMGSSMIGALAYAFTDTFWFSAVEGEVYAQSSLCTAIVFWGILRWEREANDPKSGRWLILVAYVMGLSIGVHLLNLLAIPAIGLIYYYRKFPEKTKYGWLKALAISFAIVGVALYVVRQVTISVGATVDRFFVNTLSLPVNSGMITLFILVIVALGYGIYYTHQKGKVTINTALLCLAVLMIGYTSYGQVFIRAEANPPMNSNNPSDPYALLSFLNREQYGSAPLVKGQYYSTPTTNTIEKESYYYDGEKYVPYTVVEGYEYDSRYTTIFPRMYSSDPSHVRAYEQWADIKGRKVRYEDQMITIPTFGENLRYFFSYQLNFMYWRYFMWNFVGRQNDIQSHGEITHGGWLSGIPFIDSLYSGPQDELPADLANNKGRNTYYFLPLILGLLGIFYQLKKDGNAFNATFWFFFMTGIAIILYLNQPPLQPRERDYVFAGSFYAFAIWIGLGVMAIYDSLQKRIKVEKWALVSAFAISLTVPTILIAENWDDHDRSGRYIATDFGKNYLESVLPGGIIMPYGDNDTFPLWYNQEVEDARLDVRVMNLSYLHGEWYVDQMRVKSNESEPVEFTLPKEKYYRTNDALYVFDVSKKPMTAKEVVDFIKNDSKSKQSIVNSINAQYGIEIEDFLPTSTIILPVNKENAIKSGIVKPEDADLMVDSITINLSTQALYRGDYMILDMLATSDWSRPIYVTQPQTLEKLGLSDYLQNDGFAYRIVPIKTAGDHFNKGRIDTEYLYDNMMNKFKYGNIKDPKVNIDYFSDYTVSATQVRNTAARLAAQLVSEGDTIRAQEVMDMIIEEIPFEQVKHAYSSFSMIDVLFRLGDPRASTYLTEMMNNTLDHLNYYSKFSPAQAQLVGNEVDEQLMYLSNIHRIATRHGQKEVAEELERYSDLLM